MYYMIDPSSTLTVKTEYLKLLATDMNPYTAKIEDFNEQSQRSDELDELLENYDEDTNISHSDES